MLSKSLIQFSVDGQGYVPSLLFDLRSNYSGGNEDNGDLLQKVPCRHCCTQWPQPCSRPSLTHPSARLLDTHGQVWVSLLLGYCSFLLGPGVHKVLFVPSKSLFPQSCLSSSGSMVGLKATSSKMAYAIPRSTAPRAPAAAAGQGLTEFCQKNALVIANTLFQQHEKTLHMDITGWSTLKSD